MAATTGGRKQGISTFKAGLLAAVVIGVCGFFGFTRYNPFAHPFQLHATFKSANNLQPKSPVRIAGVDVGKVTDIRPLRNGTGAADVTMQLDKSALPVHTDAELKIRPRIFLEGNFFVDLQPGTPSAPLFKDGATVPIQQTATPVQFGQILEALQADTRKDLQTFLKEYAQNGLGHGGAQAYNKLLDVAPAAARFASIANQATLGTQPHDLSQLLRGQQRLSHALSVDPQALKSLVVNLNTTALAFARQEGALAATVPALRDVLKFGEPALVSLNDALPTLRAWARDALPGTISSGPTIDASLPFVTQARLLVSKPELRGLAHDLKFTIPDLARVNHATIPLLDQQRALSACQSNVLLPFSKTPIPDPDFPAYDGANNQPFYKEAPRGLVGLSGESRIGDSNGQVFHVQFGSGPANVIYNDGGQGFLAQAPSPPEGVRPIKPDHRPVFRPNSPCELQQSPDMHAAGGPPDQTVAANGVPLLPGLPLPPLPAVKATKAQDMFTQEATSYAQRTAKGQATPDPWTIPAKQYPKVLAKAGLKLTPTGQIVPK
ncbi:MAG: phospholipid/cholesterol/gamma-HCH transport system substrate-binding protein [Thermoleophilaceae bacterium]|jgi:virulence factor Mce-like protein|nr:phospholipid/cholesterol/gamma-HCH transport system substrate-binding protein [Thermoleophilaceae bacterium]